MQLARDPQLQSWTFISEKGECMFTKKTNTRIVTALSLQEEADHRKREKR